MVIDEITPGSFNSVRVQSISGSLRSKNFIETLVTTQPLPPTLLSYEWINNSVFYIEWQPNDKSQQDSYSLVLLDNVKHTLRNISIQNDTFYYLDKLNHSEHYYLHLAALSHGQPSEFVKIRMINEKADFDIENKTTTIPQILPLIPRYNPDDKDENSPPMTLKVSFASLSFLSEFIILKSVKSNIIFLGKIIS